MLEEGDKDDWFGSPFIVRFAAIAAIALPLFVLIELIGKKPLLNLRLLFRRNFGFGAPEKHLWRWMCFDKEMKNAMESGHEIGSGSVCTNGVGTLESTLLPPFAPYSDSIVSHRPIALISR